VANLLIHQFDVFANPHPERSGEFPFVLVLQSDWVSNTSSVIVAPLVPTDRERQARLYPHFEVEGRHIVAAVSDLAAIPRAVLSNPVANVSSERDRIIAALDLLFTGY
jgi:toxin CcdB